MVRLVPSFSSLMPEEWWSYSEAAFRAMQEIQAVEHSSFNHVKSQTVIRCRRTHQSHPDCIFCGENPLRYSFTLVLFEIAMLILITRAVRFLLKPLKQPRVVSEIIGGIIIGPSVLGRSKEFTKYIFPDNAIFVVKNLGVIGFMYFLFVSGVKMDLGIIRKSGKKHWFIASVGVLLPLATVSVISFVVRKSIDDKELAKPTSIGWVTSTLSITAFPVLYPILKELNLLSSEVGRQALSTAIISDVIGINVVVAFEAAKQGEANRNHAWWYTITLVGLVTIILTGVRRVMAWIVQKTPEGKPVEQIYIIAILLGVMVSGFLTDMCGIAIANGPLWLGLAIPDGPPLGATLVERSETIIMEVLMPFSFAYMGLQLDVYSISGSWSSLWPLFVIVVAGYLAKLVAILLAAFYFDMPFRESLTLGLIMSLRGQVEVLLFIHWVNKKILKLQSFSMMVVLATMVTAIATPLISILYDPIRPYMVTKRRTIQHTPPNAELHIVACIHDEDSVAGIINLLEISNPTPNSPFIVDALHLIELVGRASPVFIDHQEQDQYYRDQYTSFNTIHNALKNYEETREDLVKINLFTAVSPQRSMYQDICKLALVNKTSLIIITFLKYSLGRDAGTALVRHRLQSVNSNVLAHAPCSVGLLVEKGAAQNHLAINSLRRSTHHFAVPFLGGADAREALFYADRMAKNQDVSLTVIRFLAHNGERDDEMEKKLDDGVVTWFWVKNEANDQVVYREVVVRNGEETLAAIHAMNDSRYDLWIIGRKQGINPVLLDGLSDWIEHHELGLVGDYVASTDFGGSASVLVVQQQVLRGQGSATAARSRERFRSEIS